MSNDQSPTWDELREVQSRRSADDDDILRILEGEQPTHGLPPIPDDDVDPVERWAVQERLNEAVALLRGGMLAAQPKHLKRLNSIVKESFDNTEGTLLERYAETARVVQVAAGIYDDPKEWGQK